MSYQEEEQARLRRLCSKQAIALAMEGRWQEAVAANQSLIESIPDDVDAYNRLGRAYMELRKYSQSREAYSRALELDPYNTIAEKNLRRLSHLGETVAGSDGDTGKVEPRHFIEETGKAGVVNLCHLASLEILAKIAAGDRVYLKIGGSNLVVENGQGEYLGHVGFKGGQRLVKLMEGGNEYTANIVRSSEDMVTVIIREVYQHPSQAGQLSFPTRVSEGLRSDAGDRMIKRDPEYDEDLAEEPGDTIVGEAGEVLFDEFRTKGAKTDSIDKEA